MFFPLKLFFRALILISLPDNVKIWSQIYVTITPRPDLFLFQLPGLDEKKMKKLWLIEVQGDPSESIQRKQMSSMTHKASSPVVNIVFTLICFVSLDFEEYGRTDNMCENNYHYRPWLWVGRVNQENRTVVFNDPLGQFTLRPGEDLFWFIWFWILVTDRWTCLNIEIICGLL